MHFRLGAGLVLFVAYKSPAGKNPSQCPTKRPQKALRGSNRNNLVYDCTNLFEFAIDINIPNAKPRVTIAVPP
jgi:hypothetical protein